MFRAFPSLSTRGDGRVTWYHSRELPEAQAPLMQIRQRSRQTANRSVRLRGRSTCSSGGLRKPIVFAGVLILCVGAPAFADGELAAAMKGQVSAETWTSYEDGELDLPSLVDRAIDRAGHAEDAVHVGQALSAAYDRESLTEEYAPLVEKAAELLSLLGRFELAAPLHEAAYGLYDNLQARDGLFRAAALYLELGERRKTLELLEELDSLPATRRGRERNAILLARVLELEGERDEALELLDRLPASADVMLVRRGIAARGGRGEEVLAVEAWFAEREEASLAELLAEGNRYVGGFLWPSLAFEAIAGSERTRPEGEPPEQSAIDEMASVDGTGHSPDSPGEAGEPNGFDLAREAADMDSGETRAVGALQLGSFTERRNAERLVEILADLDWTAELEYRESHEAYKVRLNFDRPVTRNEAEEILLELREDGVEGFVIYED